MFLNIFPCIKRLKSAFCFENTEKMVYTSMFINKFIDTAYIYTFKFIHLVFA